MEVLGVTDYVILSLTMCASLAIGLYFKYSGGKKKTNEEYLFATKSMSLIPVGISLMSSFISGITVLGNSAETYTNGMLFIALVIGYLISTPIIAYLYLPVFYNLDISSTYEYLEMRFGPKIRILVSLSYTVQMLLYNGIVIYAPALAIEAVTGLDRYISIILVGIVSTIYSTIGGMKAVIWTDSLQTTLMFSSIILVIIFGVIEVGGLGNTIEYAQNGGRLDFSSISIDPTVRHSWWSLMIGGLFINTSLMGVNHTQVVRFKSLQTLKSAKAAAWMCSILIIFSTITSTFSGIVIYAVYRSCDPFSDNSITAYDQILPFFVMQYISHIPGIAGLFIAGLLSASLSTISSASNGLAGVTIIDYLGRWVKPSLLLSRIAVLTFNLVFMAVALIAGQFGGVAQAALSLFGAFGGPILGVFTLGMLTTFNNENGAIIGLLIGLGFNMWISFGGPRPANELLDFSTEGCNNTLPAILEPSPMSSEFFYLYRISYQYLGLIGFCCVVIIGSLVSLLWKTKQPWERNGEKGANPLLFCSLLKVGIKHNNTVNNIENDDGNICKNNES